MNGINDKLDYLIGLALSDYAAEEVEAFEAIDASDSVIDEDFDKRIYRLIAQKAEKPKVKRIGIRVAIAAIIIVSLMLITIMSISGIREALWNAIVKWYEDYVAIAFVEPSPEVIDIDVSSGNIVVDTSKANFQKEILEYKKPTVSGEYVKETIYEGKAVFGQDYYLNGEWQFSFYQKVYTVKVQKIDSKGKELKNITVGEYDAIIAISQTNEPNILIWMDGEYLYTINGYLSENELIELAKTVK